MAARIAVRVVPRSSRTAIERGSDGSWRVRVTAAPTDGQANAALLAVVADATGLAKSAVRIVVGGSGRAKVLEFDGMEVPDVIAAFERAGGAGRDS